MIHRIDRGSRENYLAHQFIVVSHHNAVEDPMGNNLVKTISSKDTVKQNISKTKYKKDIYILYISKYKASPRAMRDGLSKSVKCTVSHEVGQFEI